MIALVIAMLIAVAGCGVDQPHLELRFAPGTPQRLQDLVWEGASMWDRDGAISFAFETAEEAGAGIAGLETGCNVEITEGLSELELVAVAAHEAGHCLYSTGDHLPPYEHGIMAAFFDGSDELTDADRAWAEAHDDTSTSNHTSN